MWDHEVIRHNKILDEGFRKAWSSYRLSQVLRTEVQKCIRERTLSRRRDVAHEQHEKPQTNSQRVVNGNQFWDKTSLSSHNSTAPSDSSSTDRTKITTSDSAISDSSNSNKNSQEQQEVVRQSLTLSTTRASS